MNSIEERNKKILLIILIVALVVLGIYKIFFEKNGLDEPIDTETISIVSEPNDFYTVSSCVSKYLNYLAVSDSDNLLVLISNEYKKENSITKENIYNFIGTLTGVHSFNARKMFVQRLSQNTYKYYVYGFISRETINTNPEENNFYIVVILDRKNGTFAIEPYDGSMFK